MSSPSNSLPVSLTKSNRIALLRRFYKFVKPHRALVLCGGAAMALSVLLALPAPYLTMYIIDRVIPRGDVTGLLTSCTLILAVLVIRTTASFKQMLYFSRLNIKVTFGLRNAVLAHLETLPLDFFHHKHSAYLSARISNDCNAAVQGLLAQSLFGLIRDIVTFLVGVIALMIINGRLTLLTCGLLPAYVVSILKSNRRLRTATEEAVETTAKASGCLQETLSSMYVVQAFVAEKRELIRNLSALKKALKADQHYQILMVITSLSSGFIAAIAPLIVVLYGGLEIIRHQLTVGQLVAFSSFVGYLFGPTERVINLNAIVQSALVSLERVFELLDTRGRPCPLVAVRGPEGICGRIELRNVSFRYSDGSKVLNGATVTIDAKECVAVVGRSGIGKTTMLNLIMRFLEAQEGRILLDGKDILDYDPRFLRSNVGLVPQEPLLFSGTLADNIGYGKHDVSWSEMVEAATRANAHQFIERLVHGYNTIVGERGVGLSVGERQRICIARAILRDPPLLLLDEPTSAVDAHSEELIRTALEDLIADRTCIIVTHRPSLLTCVNRILTLDESGTILDQPCRRSQVSYNSGSEPRKLLTMDEGDFAPGAFIE